MKRVVLTVFITLVVIFIILSQLKSINHPISENDEGIYLTSFHLINKGHLPYRETFFSQPPGFILTTYPGYILLDKTLSAARLTVVFWSTVGLFKLLLIGFELGNVLIGVLTVILLFLIPSYYRQTLIFQSDVIVGALSLLSLATYLRFYKTKNTIWLISSSFFLNFAFWTKFDITFFPSFLVLLYLIKVNKKIILTFLMTSFLFFVIFIIPFGLREVFSNSILLRFQAINLPTNFFLLFDYLKKDLALLGIICTGFLLAFFRKEKLKYPLNIIFLWGLTSITFFFFYRPLFPHHLAILSIPVALLFSYSIFLVLKSKIKLYIIIVFIITSVFLVNRVNTFFTKENQILHKDHQKAINIIRKNTQKDDLIVSDEQILSAASDRLPPPELSDISYVRIRSKNLSPEKFAKIINEYKPKMIIPWNGRLREIENFNRILVDYHKIATLGKSKEIYLLKSN